MRLKFGDRISGLTVTLAEGAGSLHGMIQLAAGERVPAKLFMNLVPAEKRTPKMFCDSLLSREFKWNVRVNNVPPGRYWALARVAGEGEPQRN